ncbi:MAG: hypothetical protein JXR53_01770 [Bacteroidales bacterium]|nr:hypothetical protein [Bacteroidales bacterium]
MKRFQVLAIILLSGGLLFIASCLWPDDDVQITLLGKERNIQFMNAEEMMDFRFVDNTANIDSVIAILESRVYGINEDIISRMSILDESIFDQSAFFENPIISGKKTALDNFFRALQTTDSTLIRVGHYGDSQIEGDRITSLLRIMFQSKFGGNGVGYVPMEDVTSPISYSRISSGNWVRYTVFTNKSSHNLYSPGGTVFRYRFFVPESSRDSISEEGDTIKITTPAVSYSNATMFLKVFRSYGQAKIWYGKAEEPAELKVYDSSNGDLLAEMTLDNPDPFNVVNIPLSRNSLKLRFVFTGPSPEIYGLTFDPGIGIQFDNYGLRGHSGDGLMLISKEFLGNEFRMINNKLAILQFGGNVTPYVKNEKSLENIKNIYDRLYAHFKLAYPEASVLVIGVNDVARSVGGTYMSYPMVGRIRDVQKEVAIKNGCAFFDLLELMGGENSVMAWYRKGLASRDGHYSDRGREIVVNEIYLAIMAEYNKYLLHTRSGGQ